MKKQHLIDAIRKWIALRDCYRLHKKAMRKAYQQMNEIEISLLDYMMDSDEGMITIKDINPGESITIFVDSRGHLVFGQSSIISDEDPS